MLQGFKIESGFLELLVESFLYVQDLSVFTFLTVKRFRPIFPSAGSARWMSRKARKEWQRYDLDYCRIDESQRVGSRHEVCEYESALLIIGR